MKNLFNSLKINSKNSIILFCTALVLFSNIVIPQQAKASNRGLAVTGVVLGAAALGVAGYSVYRQRNPRRYYNDGYYQNRRPVYSRRPVGHYHHPAYNRGYGPRNGYRNTRYYNHY